MSGLYNWGRLSVPGGFLMLSLAPYAISDGTLETLESKMRKVEASGAFHDGSWTVQATKENDAFPLAVRVRDPATLAPVFAAVQTLRDALTQTRYTLELKLGTWSVAYTCFAADVTVECSKPLLYASQALVRAQMSAIPT